jgi:hypothetical protein
LYLDGTAAAFIMMERINLKDGKCNSMVLVVASPFFL